MWECMIVDGELKMQYILNENEYDELVTTKRNKIAIDNKKLQTLCSKIADEMPIVWGWGSQEPRPWGCILTQEQEWYCDQCPVQEICPNQFKSWSK